MMYEVRKDLPFYFSLLILGTMRFYPLGQKSKKRFFVELIVMLILGNVICADVLVLFGSSLKSMSLTLRAQEIIKLSSRWRLLSGHIIISVCPGNYRN